MRIGFVCTQPPGYGGAATSSYEAIKHLRRLGVEVTGLFIDHCGECERGDDQPFDAASDWHDPDGIGGVLKIPRCKASIPGYLAGEYDMMIGKNYGAAILLGGYPDVPRAYLTSGLDSLDTRHGNPFTDYNESVPAASKDAQAVAAVDEVIVHSSLLLEYLAEHLPENLRSKVRGPVIPTPDMTVPADLPDPIPYTDRRFDVALIASSWKRPVKNRWTAKYVSLDVGARGGRVVVAGKAWGFPSTHETAIGLVSHAQAMEAIADSRVVVVPSLFDAAPGIYTEAIRLGCNVVVSRNVGNCWDHPAELMALSLDYFDMCSAVRRAVALDRQLDYRRIDPESTARQLLARCEEIVGRHG